MVLDKRYQILIFFFFYIFFFFFFCSQLSPLYELNTWTDVNVYFTIGKGLMNGFVIYRDLFDHKGPLIFFIYGFGYLISNTSFFGIFLIEVCIYTITVYYVYLIIKLSSKPILALSVSLIFPVFYLFYSYKGGAAEDFVLVAEVISLYYFLTYFHKKLVEHPPKYMLIHGFMFGCVFLIKLNLILFWFFPLLLIFFLLTRNKLYCSLFQNFLYLILGFLLITLPVFFYFAVNKSFDSFWEAYIDFNILYNSQLSSGFFARLISSATSLKMRDFVFLSVCLLGFSGFIFGQFLEKRLGLLSILLSFIIQLIVIFSGAFFFSYYFLVAIVFAVLGLKVLAVILQKITLVERIRYLPIICAVVFLLIGSVRTNLFGYSINNVINRDFPEDEIGLFAKEIMKKDNPSLLCLGFDESLAIFTVCDLVPSVRFFFLPNITMEHFPDICNTQIGYVENKEVDFLVLDERFRYYEHYIRAVDKNYKIQSRFVGPLGNYILLYNKK